MADNSTIITCVVVSTGLTLAGEYASTGPKFATFFDGALLGGALLLVNDFAPQVAGAIALVVMVTAFLTHGGPVLARLSGSQKKITTSAPVTTV